VDRLSVLDAEFLHLEDGITHMHMAGLSVFEGPTPDLHDIEHLLATKLHQIPRYRQRISNVPFELGRPVWEDDPHFNLAYHVRHVAVPAPGDDAAVCRLMGRVMSQPLDRNRPLWETWLVESLADDRWALISKVHHCMVDGIAGVGLITVLLAAERDAPLPDPPPWRAAPEPNGVAKIVDAWAGLGDDLISWVRRVPGTARDPLGALRSGAHDVSGLLRFARHLSSTPSLSIEGTIGPNRMWAHSSVQLADVRVIRKTLGGTVNDVVLATVAGAYRELLLRRGEDADGAVVRTLVPVSVRTDDARGVSDNRVSAILYELPIAIADPLDRLHAVMDAMGELKSSHMAEAGEAVTTIGNLAPPMVIGPVTRFSTRVMRRLPQRSINTVTTNVPGPQMPLYCLGREMLEYVPYVPIYQGVRIGTAILSYNGRLAFGVTGDFDTAPDVTILADAIPYEVDQLLKLAH